MRFRHILSETAAGLRQNLTMTLAVIMTMWVSLSLFGAGLLASQQVDLMKGRWYDKIEISIFLCTKDTRGDNCEPGQDVTQAQKDVIRETLEANPEVAPDGIYFETKAEAWAEFQRAYEGSPIQDSLEIDIMRLVGASNFYITVPFLLEAVISALVGVALACVTLGVGVYVWIIRGVRESIRFVAWIGWRQTGLAMLAILAVGIVLAVIPTVVTTRRYLRV